VEAKFGRRMFKMRRVADIKLGKSFVSLKTTAEVGTNLVEAALRRYGNKDSRYGNKGRNFCHKDRNDAV